MNEWILTDIKYFGTMAGQQTACCSCKCNEPNFKFCRETPLEVYSVGPDQTGGETTVYHSTVQHNCLSYHMLLLERRNHKGHRGPDMEEGQTRYSSWQAYTGEHTLF